MLLLKSYGLAFYSKFSELAVTDSTTPQNQEIELKSFGSNFIDFFYVVNVVFMKISVALFITPIIYGFE